MGNIGVYHWFLTKHAIEKNLGLLHFWWPDQFWT